MPRNIIIEESVIPSEVQTEVLAYLLQDKDTLARFNGSITEEHFDNPVHRIIYSVIKPYYTRYKTVPTKKIVEDEIGSLIASSGDLDFPTELIWRELASLYYFSTAEREYVKDKIISYLIRNALEKLGNRALSVAETDAPDVEEISREVTSFYKVVAGNEDDKSEFLLRDAPNRIREDASTDKIPTGLPMFDKVLEGGLGKGELGVMLAPTGFGKSHWLVTVGANALMIRKNVLHFTFEISKKNVIRRYEAFTSKIPKKELYVSNDKVHERIMRLRRVLPTSDVLVAEYPTGSLSVDELRSVINQYRSAKNFFPDLVIIDYADILKKPRLKDGEGKDYAIVKEMYEKLRGVAMEFDVPIWTGSQTSKKAMEKEVVTSADIAESFGKAMVADVVAAICRTKDEKKDNKGRFFIEKSRETASHVIIGIKTDFDTSRFTEDETRHIENVDPASVIYEDASTAEADKDLFD